MNYNPIFHKYELLSYIFNLNFEKKWRGCNPPHNPLLDPPLTALGGGVRVGERDVRGREVLRWGRGVLRVLGVGVGERGIGREGCWGSLVGL